MSGRLVKVYHYTDAEGRDAIERTGRIEPSTDGRYGPGTYLTSMPPSEGRKAVSQNNWDGGWQNLESRGRADYAIELKIPEYTLRDPTGPKDRDRDVLIYDGPIHLRNYKWKTMQKK